MKERERDKTLFLEEEINKEKWGALLLGFVQSAVDNVTFDDATPLLWP